MTRSPSCLPSAAAELLLTREPLRLEEALSRVGGPGHGAVVSFLGCVRDSEDGRPIGAIDYEAYAGMAERQLALILRQAREKWPGLRAAAHHRYGRVAAGEPSLVVAVSTGHRAEAFRAAQFIIDRIKEDVPVWKVGYEWVR